MLDIREDAEQRQAVVLSGASGGGESPAREIRRIHGARTQTRTPLLFPREPSIGFQVKSEDPTLCVRPSVPRLAGTRP